MLDAATGRSRGFGFVRFTSEEERNRAITEMNGVFVGSKPIRVSLATRKPPPGATATTVPGSTIGSAIAAASAAAAAAGGAAVPSTAPTAPPPPHTQQPAMMHSPPMMPPAGAAGTAGSTGGVSTSAASTATTGGGAAATAAAGAPIVAGGGGDPAHNPTNTTLFIGGLSAMVSEAELHAVFARCGEIVYTKIPPGKGCGFVQFVTRQAAEYALEALNGTVLGGMAIRVSWGKSSRPPSGPHVPSPIPPGLAYGGGAAYAGAYGGGGGGAYMAAPGDPYAAAYAYGMAYDPYGMAAGGAAGAGAAYAPYGMAAYPVRAVRVCCERRSDFCCSQRERTTMFHSLIRVQCIQLCDQARCHRHTPHTLPCIPITTCGASNKANAAVAVVVVIYSQAGYMAGAAYPVMHPAGMPGATAPGALCCVVIVIIIIIIIIFTLPAQAGLWAA